jgi:uncharacterized membrane protein YdbT with pleckstrin-like domain
MSQILSFKEGARIGGGTRSTGTLLSDHPDTRISILWFGSLLAAIVLGAAGIYAPIDNAVRFGLGLTALLFAVAFPVMLAKEYFTLRLARYSVTDTYVEARTGIFEKTERRIPLAYIREVTTKQTFFQSLFGTRNIKVFATNGDSIELQNIRDGERKRELIWELVMANSPGRSHQLG